MPSVVQAGVRTRQTAEEGDRDAHEKQTAPRIRTAPALPLDAMSMAGRNCPWIARPIAQGLVSDDVTGSCRDRPARRAVSPATRRRRRRRRDADPGCAPDPDRPGSRSPSSASASEGIKTVGDEPAPVSEAAAARPGARGGRPSGARETSLSPARRYHRLRGSAGLCPRQRLCQARGRSISGRVKGRQLLAEIETPELQPSRCQAQALVLQAKANVEIARITYNRYLGW